MKKAVCVILAAVLLACSGCSGRGPVPGENAALAQNNREGELSDESGSPGGEAAGSNREGDNAGNDSSQHGNNGRGSVGSGGKEEEAVSEITVWIGGDLRTLDPAKALYTTEKTMLLHAYETLLIYDENHQLVPGQAESYEVSPDGLTYTFHLRDGLAWSDGSKLTASDFVYSWKRLADYSTASPYGEDMLSLVAGYEKAAENGGEGLGVSAPDERTFVVTLSQPWVNFPQICAYPALSPLKESYVTGTDENWSLSAEAFVGNGPMKLAERKGGWYITFEKNEHYWNQEAVSMKSITFWLNGNEENLEKQYEAGRFQLMLCDADALKENQNQRQELLEKNQAEPSQTDLSDQEQQATEGKSLMQGYQAPVSGTYYIMFNMQEEAFQDRRVRKALSMMLDQQEIAETVMEGEVLPADSLIGPGISDQEAGKSFWQAAGNRSSRQQDTQIASAYPVQKGTEEMEESDEEKESEESDAEMPSVLEQAKELLEEAGYPNGRGLPVIEFLTNDAGYHLDLGRYLQKAWNPLGVQVKTRKVSWQNFVPYRHNSDFMAARASWVMDMDDPLSLLEQFSTDHLRNDGHYSNWKLDSAIRQAKEATDRATYYQALHQAEDIILEDNAVIPIAYYQDSWLQDESLTGIRHLPDGTWRFSYGTIVN
ncbi:MAG: peptide ABC transporter substrate-binding protein [Lachnospiraceae bacterium]|nr:peptide ABC transporter substrate-binding protein [Lachnospiraceae bacterium]